MKALFLFSCIAFLQFTLFPTPAISAGQGDPSRIIRKSTERVMTTLTEQKQLHGEKVTEQMVRALIEVLEPVVDFQSIAKSVMGKHGKKANARQLQNFTHVFTESLVGFYTKSLLTFEVKTVTVLDQDADFDPHTGRTTVQMQATDSESNSYDIRYSMRTNGKGEWKVRNFIVEGVNVGLTFLNQFDGAMARHADDIDTVIDNWSDEMAQSKENVQP
jgi:phospholipid transport system substrate-binding protein